MRNVQVVWAKQVVWALILVLASIGGANAAELEKIKLDPAPIGAVAFTLVEDSKRVDITIAEIEALGLRRTRTTSPWEAGEFTLEGVLLADVLAHIGLKDAQSILLVAGDGFSAIVPREDWTEGPVLLVTRRDGELLTRRTQGPTRLVYPELDYPPFDDPIYKPRWIWVIATIEELK